MPMHQGITLVGNFEAALTIFWFGLLRRIIQLTTLSIHMNLVSPASRKKTHPFGISRTVSTVTDPITDH
jgi:hypothetical protein